MKDIVDQMKDNAQQIAQDVKEREGDFGNLRNIAGLVVVGVGVLALLNSITGFSFFRWDLFWPIILIFVGGLILFNKK